MNYVVSVKDGRVLAGLLAGENSESITLRRADGEDSIPRSEIEELRNTGRSLMPEGFEKNLSPQDFANLLSFLKKGEPPKP
jgi:putative heme-binding domain-containing protein